MDRINQLFDKYKNNQCNPAEIEELLAYFNISHHRDLLKSHIDMALKQNADDSLDLQNDTDEVYSKLQEHIFNKKNNSNRLLSLGWIVAASIVLCLSYGTYLVLREPGPVKQVAQVQKQDLLPGTDKATLTIANGQKIDVGGAHQGKIAIQGNTAINKTNDGRIVYHSAGKLADTQAPVYNTMTTPRGGQHPLTLSDGTKVWLDAASSITFPVAFTGNERTVEITGQVYFEVAHNAAKPFKVTANGQTVEVLGTHFNINAYTDEPEMKTTLFEGSVKVTKNGKTGMLVPGQQAIVPLGSANSIEVKTADTDEAIAWHMGLFKFHDATIQAVMRQLARWYDVDISYEGNVPDRHFSGEIYRNVKASKIADILSYKKIHFRIEGKKIVVLP